MKAAQVADLTPAAATWLGWQAAKMDRLEEGRDLVPVSLEEHYEKGVTLPDDISVMCPGGENMRRRLMRRLGGDPEPKRRAPPLEVSIAGITQRKDVGTSTRYDVELIKGERSIMLRDLLAGDLLTWSRLRPIALDCGVVLQNLEQGQVKLWLAEVERAMGSARVVKLSQDESEAGEILDVLQDIMADAQTWEWADDDPYPRGIARVVFGEMEGWTRGPMQDAIRAKIGRVGRVQLARALRSLGLSRREWKVESAYVRVWARTTNEGDRT